MKRGPGFVVLYRWRLHPGREEAFIGAWSRVTDRLLREGSYGSRLHRGPEGIWYGYAQWPDEATRRVAFDKPGDPADGEIMRGAVAESFPEIVLESVSDWLVLPPKGVGA